MLRFENFQYIPGNGRVEADILGDREGTHFVAEGDVSPAVDEEGRSLAQIYVPAEHCLSVESLAAGKDSLLYRFLRPIDEDPGAYLVNENVGIQFLYGFYEDGLVSGFRNHFGPLLLRDLVTPVPAASQEPVSAEA
jgi:hypothetical protein